MAIDYIREHVEKDIELIRTSYGEDISLDVGIFLADFVARHNKDFSAGLFKNVFFKKISLLEKELAIKMEKPVSLYETANSGHEICRILQQRNREEELEELRNYIHNLVRRGGDRK